MKAFLTFLLLATLAVVWCGPVSAQSDPPNSATAYVLPDEHADVVALAAAPDMSFSALASDALGLIYPFAVMAIAAFVYLRRRPGQAGLLMLAVVTLGLGTVYGAGSGGLPLAQGGLTALALAAGLGITLFQGGANYDPLPAEHELWAKANEYFGYYPSVDKLLVSADGQIFLPDQHKMADSYGQKIFVAERPAAVATPPADPNAKQEETKPAKAGKSNAQTAPAADATNTPPDAGSPPPNA